MAVLASTIGGIATYEGYRESAYIPIPGDVPTIGFGHTEDVQLGDTITREAAEVLLYETVKKVYAQGVKDCVTAPLYQHEFDIMVSFAYNVGVQAFCSSTLVKKLNAEDYDGACNELSRWVYAKGKRIQGLANRREEERKLCLGIKGE